MKVCVWRHPRAQGVAGRCIGRSDVPVDPRRAKRLAHRIRSQARRQGWPRCISTSPLQRAASVGRWLKRWGWQHRVDPLLLEADFGTWDGQPWAAVPQTEVDAWCADFLHAAPGGGESLQQLFQRVALWQAALSGSPDLPTLVVGHAGWMAVLQWLAGGEPWPTRAEQWPAAARHGQRCCVVW